MATYNNLTTPRTAPGSATDAARQQAIDLAMISPKTAPAPTATPTTAPARTPSLYEKALSDRTAATKSYEDALATASTYAAQQRQARIDAINTAFAPRIQREEKAGADRMQRVKALTFKSGITGSGADTTKLGEQSNLNSKALQDIEASKAMAIQEAFDKADALAVSMANQTYDRSSKTAEANVAEAKYKVDSAMEILKSFGTAGVKTAQDLLNADKSTYDNLKKTTGMSDSEVDTYLKINAPKGTYQWDQAKFNGNKMYVPTIKNGVPAMEEVTLNFTPTKEVQGVTKTDTGVFVLYKDGTYQTVGIPGNEKKPTPADIKVFVNQQMATPEFKKLTDEQKADYIRSQGGTPYDFGL